MSDLEIQHGFAQTADDVSLAYQVSGQGPALVCCHPMAWDHTIWDAFRVALSRNHRLITFDQRGAGDSDHPPFTEGPDSAYTVESFGEDLRAVLDELGVERAALLGFSMGAVTVLSFATRWPQRVDRLILASAMASRLPEAIVVGARRVEKILQEQGVEAAYDVYFAGSLFEGLAQGADFAEQLASVRGKATADGFQGCYRVTIDRPSLVDRLGRIECPTLILVGERDIHYLKEADLLAEKIANSEKIVVANAGHPMTLQAPEFFEEQVLNFLA